MRYDPADYSICDGYKYLETIYSDPLSTAVVDIVKSYDTGEKLIKKAINKNKLCNDELIHQARRECAINDLFNHPNVISLKEYTESVDDLCLFMELANDPGYFETKLAEKHREIKNETKLKSYA